MRLKKETDRSSEKLIDPDSHDWLYVIDHVPETDVLDCCVARLGVISCQIDDMLHYRSDIRFGFPFQVIVASDVKK